MHASRQSNKCPACGQTYAEMIVVARGTDWRDIFAGRPLGFFRKYQRRCSSRQNVETGSSLGRGEIAVYFHEGPDGVRLIGQGGPP